MSSENNNNLNVLEILRHQAHRRQQERNKIHVVATAPVDPEESRSVGDEENGGPLKTAAINNNNILQLNKNHHPQKNSSPSSSPNRNDRATNTFPTLENDMLTETSSAADGTSTTFTTVLISPARQQQIIRASSPSQQRCRSPTEGNVTHAQLKSRISVLENETESLRAVVDLARKENAALRDLILKMAKKTMGDDWRSELGIDLNLGTSLAGMGQPAAELTFTQRQRLIELLDGQRPNLLP